MCIGVQLVDLSLYMSVDTDSRVVIGRGQMSTVYVCFWSSDKCIKEMCMNEFAVREILALRRLTNCPNIVQIESVFAETDFECISFTMNRMDITLNGFIQNSNKRLEELIVCEITRQIANGVYECHSFGIVHCDLKPDNILICAVGDVMQVQLSDFGLSTTDGAHCLGTRWYKPIELLKGNSISFSRDIWALGCVVAEMYRMCPLFPGRSDWEQVCLIQQAFAADGRIHANMRIASIEGRLFVHECLNDRTEIALLFEHKWLTKSPTISYFVCLCVLSIQQYDHLLSLILGVTSIQQYEHLLTLIVCVCVFVCIVYTAVRPTTTTFLCVCVYTVVRPTTTTFLCVCVYCVKNSVPFVKL